MIPNFFCPICNTKLNLITYLGPHPSRYLYFSCPNKMYYENGRIGSYDQNEYFVSIDMTDNSIYEESIYLTDYLITLDEKETCFFTITPIVGMEMKCYGGMPMEENVPDIEIEELLTISCNMRHKLNLKDENQVADKIKTLLIFS